MGQDITVTEFAGVATSVKQFVCNRSLTGMKTERYPNREAAPGNRPPDVLARRLFDLGATSVTVYSNVVTVEMPAAKWDGAEAQVDATVANLFRFYGDDAGWSFEARGVEPPASKVE
ncbi:MAG: hypothetical protein ACOYNI_08465 [Acidimicrobiia bacterium]